MSVIGCRTCGGHDQVGQQVTRLRGVVPLSSQERGHYPRRSRVALRADSGPNGSSAVRMSTGSEVRCRSAGDAPIESRLPTKPNGVNDRVIRETALLLEWLVVLSLVVTLASRPQAFSSPLALLLAIGCRTAGTIALSAHVLKCRRFTATAALASTLLTGAVALNLASGGRPGEARIWIPIMLQVAGTAAFIAGLGLTWWVAPFVQGGLGTLIALLVGAATEAARVRGLALGDYLAFALVPGAAGGGVRLLLAREASQASAALCAALAGHTAAVHQSARLASLDEHRRILHDTALNTLAAIARGGPGPARQSVQRQAQRDALALTRLAKMTADAPSDESVADQLRRVVADFTDSGMHVQLRATALPEIPPHVRHAFASACREALNNVRKHAGRCEVAVDLSRHGAGIQLQVRDDGRGFCRDDTDFGLGLRESILGRMGDVGGSATVHGLPEGGTEVVLGWSPAGAEPPTEPPRSQRVDASDASKRTERRLGQIGMLMVALYTLSAGLSVIELWTGRGLAANEVVANAVFFSVAAAALLGILRMGTLTPYMSAALILQVPVSVLLTALPRLGCQTTGFDTPLGGCMVGAVVVLGLFRPAREAAAFCATCAGCWIFLAISETRPADSCAGTVAPNTMTAVANTLAVVAAAICAMWFARAVRRHSQAATSALTASTLTEAAIRTEQAIADDRTQLYRALAATVLPTLQGIGAGVLDPGSSQVRARCASDAVLLRGYLNDVITGHPLTSAIFAVAVDQTYSGPPLDIRGIGGNHDVPADIVTTMVCLLRREMRRYDGPATRRRAVSVTVIDDGVTVAISLVGDHPDPQPADALSADILEPMHEQHVEVAVEGTDEGQLWVRVTHCRPATSPPSRPTPSIAGRTAARARRRLNRIPA